MKPQCALCNYISVVLLHRAHGGSTEIHGVIFNFFEHPFNILIYFYFNSVNPRCALCNYISVVLLHRAHGGDTEIHGDYILKRFIPCLSNLVLKLISNPVEYSPNCI